jgi:hypothetical protein
MFMLNILDISAFVPAYDVGRSRWAVDADGGRTAEARFACLVVVEGEERGGCGVVVGDGFVADAAWTRLEWPSVVEGFQDGLVEDKALLIHGGIAAEGELTAPSSLADNSVRND